MAAVQAVARGPAVRRAAPRDHPEAVASVAASLTNLPAGPFVQIVGGYTTFCALRSSGTTACWGDHELIIPAGW